MAPIRKGDGTPLEIPGVQEVRSGDGRVFFEGDAIPDSAIDQFERDDLDFYTAVSGSLSDWNITTSESFGPDSTRSLFSEGQNSRIQSDAGDGLESYPERGDPFYYFTRSNGTSSFVVGYLYFGLQDQSGGGTPDNAYSAEIGINDDTIRLKKLSNGSEVINESTSVSLGNQKWWCGQIYWDTDGDGEIVFEVIDPSDWSTLDSISVNDTDFDSSSISIRSDSSSGTFYDEVNKGIVTERFD